MDRLRSHSASARLFFLGALALVAAVIARPSWASDHEDEPSLIDDKGADIGDVYAFVRPGGTSHLVLAMTVHPGAAAGTKFDAKVEYQFHVLGYDGAAIDPTVDTRITCRFQPAAGAAAQVMLCDANGDSITGLVGTATSTDANAPFRAWAGLRADPAFGDVAALKSTLASKESKFQGTGTNAFAGKNVLAIVVEVAIDDVLLTSIDTSGGRPLLAVNATTERL